MTITSQGMMPDATRIAYGGDGPQGAKQSVTITGLEQGQEPVFDARNETRHDPHFHQQPKDRRRRTDPSSLAFACCRCARTRQRSTASSRLARRRSTGGESVGFRMTADHGTPFDLWGDPETGLPVRVEMTLGMNGNMKVIFSDFVFNAPMDKSLFSIEPPAGYTVGPPEGRYRTG